jgi:GntR family transcriptional repressor for pyruvate dehydrogenase complex
LLRRRTLTSQVIEYVLDLIRSGKAKVGESLPTEKELTVTLGVSRTCVREGLKSLEFLRLIRVRPRTGAVVLEASPTALLSAERFSSGEHVEEPDVLLEFRKIIEVGVASLAAEKANEEDIFAMEKALDTYKEELERGNLDCYTDMSFHAAVAAASKNPMAIMVWEMICPRLAEVLSHTIQIPKVPELSLHDHIQVLRAIKERNPAKARASMRAHLENADRIWRIAKTQKPSAASADESKTAVSTK